MGIQEARVRPPSVTAWKLHSGQLGRGQHVLALARVNLKSAIFASLHDGVDVVQPSAGGWIVGAT